MHAYEYTQACMAGGYMVFVIKILGNFCNLLEKAVPACQLTRIYLCTMELQPFLNILFDA